MNLGTHIQTTVSLFLSASNFSSSAVPLVFRSCRQFGLKNLHQQARCPFRGLGTPHDRQQDEPAVGGAAEKVQNPGNVV